MLASTMQLTNNTPTPENHQPQSQQPQGGKRPHMQPHTPIVCPQHATPHQHHSNPTRKQGVLATSTKATRHLLMFHPAHTRCTHSAQNTHTTTNMAVQGKSKLLRKEVIQPHLPVRLPCYDLVPITDPTFDDSPQKAWAIGFGCYRLS